MEIRRKVFSLLEDENGEERYYSTTEFEVSYDEETNEKLFSESKLGKSGRGYGTAMAYNGIIPGAVAVKSGRKAARKAEEEGKSESEMIDAAGKKASKVTGIYNATGVALSAGMMGGLAHKLSKDPEIRKRIKEKLAEDPELLKAGKKLGKKGRVGLIAAGLTAAALAPQAIKGARRAGDGARKNVTKSLAKEHKKSNKEN